MAFDENMTKLALEMMLYVTIRHQLYSVLSCVCQLLAVTCSFIIQMEERQRCLNVIVIIKRK